MRCAFFEVHIHTLVTNTFQNFPGGKVSLVYLAQYRGTVSLDGFHASLQYTWLVALHVHLDEVHVTYLITVQSFYLDRQGAVAVWLIALDPAHSLLAVTDGLCVTQCCVVERDSCWVFHVLTHHSGLVPEVEAVRVLEFACQVSCYGKLVTAYVKGYAEPGHVLPRERIGLVCLLLSPVHPIARPSSSVSTMRLLFLSLGRPDADPVCIPQLVQSSCATVPTLLYQCSTPVRNR